MSKSKTKINPEDILERNEIMLSFPGQIQRTSLLATDIGDHKSQLEEVYKAWIREAHIIDDCLRRFKNMFGRN